MFYIVHQIYTYKLDKIREKRLRQKKDGSFYSGYYNFDYSPFVTLFRVSRCRKVHLKDSSPQNIFSSCVLKELNLLNFYCCSKNNTSLIIVLRHRLFIV